jgi:hypothetical protein
MNVDNVQKVTVNVNAIASSPDSKSIKSDQVIEVEKEERTSQDGTCSISKDPTTVTTKVLKTGDGSILETTKTTSSTKTSYMQRVISNTVRQNERPGPKTELGRRVEQILQMVERSGQRSSVASLIEEARKADNSKAVPKVVDAFMRGVKAARSEAQFGVEEDDAFGWTPASKTFESHC